MKNEVKVSIVVISFNQEKFIAQALDSLLRQDVDFEYEIIIGDDSSTDKTQEIISSYKKRYPQIIVPILRKKNVGALNNFYDVLRRARGKYIAICEGDDYWTDNTKIRRQVRFLEEHQDYSVCFHLVRIVNEDGAATTSTFPDLAQNIKFNFTSLLGGNFIQTNSVMYKKMNYDNLPIGILPGDWFMHLYHAQSGNIGFINREMAAYRRHNRGIWWDAHHNRQKFWLKNGREHLRMYEALLDNFGKNERHRDIILELFGNAFKEFLPEGGVQAKQIIFEWVKEHPASVVEYTVFAERHAISVAHTLAVQRDTIIGLERENEAKQTRLMNNNITIEELNTELQAMKNTRTWRMRDKLVKIIRHS